MKLTNAFVAIGLVLGTFSSVSAGGIRTCDEDRRECNGNPAACRPLIGSHNVELSGDQAESDGDCLIVSDAHRITLVDVGQRPASARVDLLIKRSSNGIRVTLSHPSNKFTNRDQPNSRLPQISGFASASIPGRYPRGSVERTSLERGDQSVADDFGRANRVGLGAAGR